MTIHSFQEHFDSLIDREIAIEPKDWSGRYRNMLIAK
jgi:hypothetical protein